MSFHMPSGLCLHCGCWKSPLYKPVEVTLALPLVSQHHTQVRKLDWVRHQWTLENSVQCSKDNIPNDMVALENSNRLVLSGEKKSMPLGSATSKIHSFEGCGIVNMRSWSRTRIISRALLPAPWCLSTWVSHPSPARWSCHLSHPSGKQLAFCTSFLLEGKFGSSQDLLNPPEESLWRPTEESV